MRFGIPESDIFLVHEGEILEDNGSLEEYDISDEDIINFLGKF